MTTISEKIDEFAKEHGDDFDVWSEETRQKFDKLLIDDFEENFISIESGNCIIVIPKGASK